MTRTSATQLLTLLGIVVAACGDDARDTLSCPDDAGGFTQTTAHVAGFVSFTPPSTPLSVGDTLVIEGTANHEDALAIRAITIAGVPADLVDFNFRRFRAVVRYEDFVTANLAATPGQARVEAIAEDACGQQHPFAELAVAIDPTPLIDVDGLTVAIDYPGNRGYVPADGVTSATVSVVADGRAGGAQVAVTALGATMAGADGGRITLVADATDPQRAVGSFQMATTVAGTTLVTATIDGVVATAGLVASGPPLAVPASATLVPGAAFEVRIQTDGTLARCQATAAVGLSATHQTQDLTAGPVAMSRDADQHYIITVAAAADATADAAMTLTCTDDFGQFGTARFQLAIDEPPNDVFVDTLELNVALPDGRDYLPADGSERAVITVAATGRPGGAHVMMHASSGTFEGLTDGNAVLGGTGAQAQAVVLFAAEKQGTALITATSGQTMAVASIAVAGAPVIAPAGAALLPGQTLTVVALSDGRIATCSASASPGLAAVAGGAALSPIPAPVGADATGATAITLSAELDATPGDMVELTCFDDYGQAGAATFRIASP